MEAGSLGSAARPPLLVGRRGVPPGDLAMLTVRNFTLPIPRTISAISGGPVPAAAVVRNSVDWGLLGPLGPGVCTEDCMGPSDPKGVDDRVVEPWRIWKIKGEYNNTIEPQRFS